jgi:hypothetical protein
MLRAGAEGTEYAGIDFDFGHDFDPYNQGF